MPALTLIVSAALILLGVGFYGYATTIDDAPSKTALIPTALGVLLGICGLLALKPGLRKHAMHVAVVLGLLGLLAAVGRGAPGWFSGAAPESATKRLALIELACMAGICLIYVVFCVRSFVLARMARSG